MAEVLPLQALHYDLEKVGSLGDVVAPPYDVIDDEQREQLVARSPHNVVELDLPRDPGGGDPYEHSASLLTDWTEEGILTRDTDPQIWALEQDYTAPDGSRLTRRGFLARVKLAPYGDGHPAPRADPARAQGGPPATDAGDPPQPLPDLRPASRERLAAPRARPGR